MIEYTSCLVATAEERIKTATKVRERRPLTLSEAQRLGAKELVHALKNGVFGRDNGNYDEAPSAGKAGDSRAPSSRPRAGIGESG